MKEFKTPVLSVQKLEMDEIICSSDCSIEGLACLECYCSLVQCITGYTCEGLVCPRLNEI